MLFELAMGLVSAYLKSYAEGTTLSAVFCPGSSELEDPPRAWDITPALVSLLLGTDPPFPDVLTPFTLLSGVGAARTVMPKANRTKRMVELEIILIQQ